MAKKNARSAPELDFLLPEERPLTLPNRKKASHEPSSSSQQRFNSRLSQRLALPTAPPPLPSSQRLGSVPFASPYSLPAAGSQPPYAVPAPLQPFSAPAPQDPYESYYSAPVAPQPYSVPAPPAQQYTAPALPLYSVPAQQQGYPLASRPAPPWQSGNVPSQVPPPPGPVPPPSPGLPPSQVVGSPPPGIVSAPSVYQPPVYQQPLPPDVLPDDSASQIGGSVSYLGSPVPAGSSHASTPHTTYAPQTPRPQAFHFPGVTTAGPPQTPRPQSFPFPGATTAGPSTEYQTTFPQTTLRLDPQVAAEVYVEPLAEVVVNDGGIARRFTSKNALADYLRTFPEADNDQSCRIITYGPKCMPNLLMQLFDHFDFPRYSVFPYGFAGDFPAADNWGAGSCRCDRCMDGNLCGHYVLHKNLRFYMYQDVTPSQSASPMISSTPDGMIISTGNSQYRFFRADWNMQFFRFRSRKLSTSVFATDALMYQNYDADVKLRSAPLDYVFNQLEVVLSNWESVLNASAQFLSSFRVEVLEERLETDRSIIRNLLMVAQHWEHYRSILQAQLQRLEFMRDIHNDPRWTEGRTNYFELSSIARGYLTKFQALDYKITTELMQETDSLIQRVTNLITIDEGYRSRDQNESIRRLTWITFIFLPLVFTASIFSMQVDLFNTAAKWQYYIYTSLVLILMIFTGWAMLRFRRRLLLLSMVLILQPLRWLIRLVVERERKKQAKRLDGATDVEKQPRSASEETAIVLKWAASAGRTDVIRSILETSIKRNLDFRVTGGALLSAIQNGHIEAAQALIEAGDGLMYTDERGATALHWAAKMGQSTICQLMLEKGAVATSKDVDDQTPLDWAMKSDDEGTINLFLKGGKNFTRQETSNLQSLHFSARMGELDIIKELHKQGSSLEARDSKGQTPLFHAVKGKQHGIVKWLVAEGGANVTAVDKEGLTPLHVACLNCDVVSAETLLEYSANVNALSNMNLTPLHCIPHSEGARLLVLLHEKGADLDARDKTSQTLVHRAAREGDRAALLIKVASDLGASLSIPDTQENKPIHLAAESGSLEALSILIAETSDFVDIRNTQGYTPLMLAAREGHVKAMRYLFGQGRASYHVIDNHGRSLTSLSVAWGNPEVISLLQDWGADFTSIRATNNSAGRPGSQDGVHPVWHAIQDGQGADLVARILDGGLSIEYEYRGVRILQLAVEADNVDVVRLLLARGARVDQPDNQGWTALHSAAWQGDVDVLMLLLAKIPTSSLENMPVNNNSNAMNGAAKGHNNNNNNPNNDNDNDTTATGLNPDSTPPWAITDNQGWTPLDLAAFYKHFDMVKVLDPKGKVTTFAWMKWKTARIRPTAGLQYMEPLVVESVVTGRAEAVGDGPGGSGGDGKWR